MDQTSFQNGFICGMATKGLVRSGQLYQPLAYNDKGVYSYFYLDFRRILEPFSIGMFADSIIVSASSVLSVAQIEQVSATVYKVYCDISSQLKGVVVANKKTTRLRFSNGELVPVFSIWFALSGTETQLDVGYFYEKHTITYPTISSTEAPEITLVPLISIGSIQETYSIPECSLVTAAETTTITLS